jgi:hypothetical protein
MNDPLAIYLADHLARSVYAIELVNTIQEQIIVTCSGTFLRIYSSCAGGTPAIPNGSFISQPAKSMATWCVSTFAHSDSQQ